MRKTLLLLALLLPLTAFGAKTTFSGKYKDTPVRTILSDMKKETGTYVKTDKKQVDTKRRVTVTFRNAEPEEVLSQLFDCEYLITPAKKGNRFTVSRRVLASDEVLMSSTVADTVAGAAELVSQREWEQDSLHLTLLTRRQPQYINYVDSFRLTKERIERKPRAGKQEPQRPARQGSSLQAYLGGGYSSWGYKVQDGKNIGDLTGQISLRYAWFFTPEWGLGVGVDAEMINSQARLNTTRRWDNQADSEGEIYDHIATTHSWKEQQRMWMLSIPVTAQYQHMFNDRVGIFAAVGAFVGMPLGTTYNLRSGAVEHSGYYRPWNLTLTEVSSHDFYTEVVGQDFSMEKHAQPLRKVAAGVKADVGALVPLRDNIDLFVGAYFTAVCNDLAAGGEKQELGWQQPAEEGYRQHTFMEQYSGILQTNYAGSVHPWSVGVKVGVHFYPKAKKKEAPVIYDCLVLTDTTYAQRNHVDTVYIMLEDTITSLIHTLSTSVIWFDVNDYKHPKLVPADILDKVAEIMMANPSQRVHINGHASTEGNSAANQRLSDRRAQTIADLLVQRGVSREQLIVGGFSSSVEYTGENVGNRTKAELDRRVEIIPDNQK